MITKTKNMIVYTTDFHGNETFRMLPATKKCPFNEVIYDPETNVLAVIGKDQKVKPHMFPKLNDTTGKPILNKYKLSEKDSEHVQERKMLETYYEYYIDNIVDIKNFINTFAINPEHPMLSIIDKDVKSI